MSSDRRLSLTCWGMRPKEYGARLPTRASFVAIASHQSVYLHENVDGQQRTNAHTCGPFAQVTGTAVRVEQLSNLLRDEEVIYESRTCHASAVAACSDGRRRAAWRGPVWVERGTRAPDRSAHPPSWLTVVG